eukprot:Skav216396  [mRNA]  locus=scaffold457:222677:231021:+ [translate_table: standard]
MHLFKIYHLVPQATKLASRGTGGDVDWAWTAVKPWVSLALGAWVVEEMVDRAWGYFERQVLYLHQIKAPLPGTPAAFVQAVEKLQANAGRPALHVQPLLQSIGLEESMLDRPWSELSGGENQRMMLAIAIATSPACLVLDEPTSALDEASKLLVEDVLKKRGKDSCIIMATHDAKQAERVRRLGKFLVAFSTMLGGVPGELRDN